MPAIDAPKFCIEHDTYAPCSHATTDEIAFDLDEDRFGPQEDDDAPTVEEILDASHRLQSWRPDALTLDFIADEKVGGKFPFCRKCADWHFDFEICSSTTDKETHNV